MKQLRLFIGCILFAISFNLSAQFDTKFWFAAPYVTTEHDKYNEFRFVFASSKQPTTITIEQPANPSFSTITFSMAADTVEIVTIPKSSVNVAQTTSTISNYGFKITATPNPVFCYYEVNSTTPPGQLNPDPKNTEIFSLKGKNALGTHFMIPMQNLLKNDYEDIKPNLVRPCFLVLATEDETDIYIKPTKELEGHTGTGEFMIRLLKAGQFYVALAKGSSADAHPAGTEVTSTKKVAITYSDDSMLAKPFWSSGDGADIGGDQIIPVNMLGTEYIAVQGFSHFYTLGSPTLGDGRQGPFDQIFILSTEDNNRIRINGAIQTVLKKGETYRYGFTTPYPYIDGSALHIKSDHPIYVSQLSGMGFEMGYAILPAIDNCRGSKTVSITRSVPDGNQSYITLLTRKENVDHFKYYINNILKVDVITKSDFKEVPNTNGEWVFTQKRLASTQFPFGRNIRIENSSGIFHFGIIKGNQAGSCRFGYFSDFSANQYKIVHVSGDTLCEGKTLELMIDAIANANCKWTGPNGFTSTEPRIVIPNTKISHSGAYTVSGEVNDCEIEPDTAFVLIMPAAKAAFEMKVRCYPQPVEFKNTSTNTDENTIYSWDFGDGAISDEKNPPAHFYSSPGVYNVKLSASFLKCEDVVEHKVNISEVIISHDTVKRCEQELPYHHGDTAFNTFGNYQIHFTTKDGCDSVVQLALIENDCNVTVYYKDTICMGVSYQKYGFDISEQEIVEKGEGTHTFPPRIGNNDTTIYLTLTIAIDGCCPPDDFRFPNIITPSNKDGLNDYFTCPENFTPFKLEIYIYNRWGKLDYKSKEAQFKWDGTVNGKVTKGVYYYSIVMNGNCTYHGSLTVY